MANYNSRQNNPANFANRPKEEVKELARKGGLSKGKKKKSMNRSPND